MEEVPFRLTPNLMHMLSPYLVDGVLVLTMACVAHALTSRREATQPFLHLMLRDDILSWHASKSNQVRAYLPTMPCVTSHTRRRASWLAPLPPTP
jgi:phosphatidylinositol kinase/protein kinase (PI-3  family)